MAATMAMAGDVGIELNANGRMRIRDGMAHFRCDGCNKKLVMGHKAYRSSMQQALAGGTTEALHGYAVSGVDFPEYGGIHFDNEGDVYCGRDCKAKKRTDD